MLKYIHRNQPDSNQLPLLIHVPGTWEKPRSRCTRLLQLMERGKKGWIGGVPQIPCKTRGCSQGQETRLWRIIPCLGAGPWVLNSDEMVLSSLSPARKRSCPWFSGAARSRLQCQALSLSWGDTTAVGWGSRLPRQGLYQGRMLWGVPRVKAIVSKRPSCFAPLGAESVGVHFCSPLLKRARVTRVHSPPFGLNLCSRLGRSELRPTCTRSLRQ